MKVKRDFRVLREVISPERVQVMAELITIKQTKTLIGYIGESAITAHNRVYYDVMHKDTEGYVLSDYYDLVQEVPSSYANTSESIWMIFSTRPRRARCVGRYYIAHYIEHALQKNNCGH